MKPGDAAALRTKADIERLRKPAPAQQKFKKLTFTDVAGGNKFSWDVAANKAS